MKTDQVVKRDWEILTLVLNVLETPYNSLKPSRMERAAHRAVVPPRRSLSQERAGSSLLLDQRKACPGISNVPGNGYPTHAAFLATTTTGIGFKKVF